MSRQEERFGTEIAHRGLWRLMLKLPAMRGRLQIAAAQSLPLDDLFEAYEIASTTLDRFQREGEQRAREYENLCSEIETDVIRFILDH